MIDLNKPGRLFHFSEEPDIRRFDPRPSAGTPRPAVWAIHEPYEYQYLFPRHCPRVTFCANNLSDPDDIARYLSGSPARVSVAVETAWAERMRTTRLYRYELPPETFEPNDTYPGSLTTREYVSYESVTPIRTEPLGNLMEELTRRGVHVQTLPSLWELRDRILASSLPFSFIRMKNAQPREPSEALSNERGSDDSA